MFSLKVSLFLSAVLIIVIDGACKSSKSLSAFEISVLKYHNTYRGLHEDTPDLCYGESEGAKVKYTAESWSANLVATGNFKHSDSSNGYGENLFWKSASYAGDRKSVHYKTESVEAALSSWYNEIKRWDFQNSKRKSSEKGVIGHFTQVVWKGSKEVNCGVTTSGRSGTYVVCQYYPRGNYLMQYASNVMPRNGSPAVLQLNSLVCLLTAVTMLLR